MMDSVSGTYNLAYLMQHLPREMARAERHGRSLAVLNCEIDATVRVNEQLIGSIGDELMRGFVSCAKTCIRKSDWLVRSGEKEIIIVLPETDKNGARCVASKLIEAFARQELPATKELLGGAIKFKLTTMEPAGDKGGAAHLRVLLRKAEGLRHHLDKHNEKRSAETGTVHYLNDLKSGSEAEAGRNWPAT